MWGAPHIRLAMLIRRIRFTNPAVDRWPARAGARFPAPVGLKAAAVPADYGLVPGNADCSQDGGKESVRPDQEQAVRVRQPQSLGQLADEDVELLTEHQILSSSRARELSRKLSAYAGYFSTQPSRG